ncbi:LCP family protein [Streptoverticillium reticulum]|uniref:LCP family protein n=1 Tax=Streptoverticillium reticulum TaxID=1433415 RepID=UPI0039BF4408
MTAPARFPRPIHRPVPRPNRPRHSAPRHRRWGLRMAMGAAAAVLAAGGLGHALVVGIDGGISRIDPFSGLSDRPRVSRGTNFLLVGTDGRDKITEEERAEYHLGGEACHCTDTVMLVHLSADRSRASVVSLPRDTYTEIPEYTDENGRVHPVHPQKLNAAYAEGGPGLTVRAVERLTGVHLDHYLEVDFTSFMKTVDAVGGVQVCTPKPLKDDYTGLDLPVGTSSLNGGQALQYVRSRHLDGAADLGRMQRQQRFLAALMHRVAGSGVLLNPVKFHDVASTVIGSMRADRGFGTAQLVELGEAMRSLAPSSAEFTSVPIGVVDFPVPHLGSTVKWDEAAADRLFAALREDRPITSRPAGRAPEAQEAKGVPPGPGGDAAGATAVDVPPGRVHVQVFNGTGRPGLGQSVDQALRATGFATTGSPTNAPTAERTVLSYDPRWDRSVRTLAAAFPGADLRAEPGQGPMMRVIVGSDFRAVHPVRGPQSGPPPGGGSVMTGDQAVCPAGA